MTEIRLGVFANGDDVHLVWTHEEDIPGCLGFAIQCRRGDAEPKYLSNRVGFEDDHELDGQGNELIARSSRIWMCASRRRSASPRGAPTSATR